MELYDFYADWCGPCQMMKPVVEEFKNAHPEVKVVAINIDENEEQAEKFGVSTIPCFVVMKDGEEVAREVGVMPLKKLEKLIKKGAQDA